MLRNGPRVVLKTGPSLSFTFPHFYSVFGHVKNTNSVNLCQNSVFAKLSGCQK